jgi:hypothetical protein
MTVRQDIKNTLAKWTVGYDERSVPMMADCFTQDAVMSLDIGEMKMGPFDGHAEVMKHFTDHHEIQTDQRRHVTTNVVVEDVTDATARSVSYLSLWVTEDNAVRLQAAGVYRDEWTNAEGPWRIRHRHLTLDVHY